MGRQIIKQPNGKYCIFSSVCDNVTHYDMTPEEIIDLWSEESRIEIAKRVKETVDELEQGGKPSLQFTKTYDGMLNTIGVVHGKRERLKVQNLIQVSKT